MLIGISKNSEEKDMIKSNIIAVVSLAVGMAIAPTAVGAASPTPTTENTGYATWKSWPGCRYKVVNGHFVKNDSCADRHHGSKDGGSVGSNNKD